MARIPTYKKQPLDSINPSDILLGEKVVGTDETSTYDFQTLQQYFQGGGSGGSSLEKDIQASLTVGGINQGDVVLQYTTFTEFVELLIAPLVNPTMELNSVTCGGVNTENKEVGESYSTTLTSTYNTGVIHNADGSGDVPLTGDKTTHLFFGTGANGQDGTVLANIVKGSNVWGVQQSYSQGVLPYYDSAGGQSNVFDSFRVAGTSSDNSNVITGKYKYWSMQFLTVRFLDRPIRCQIDRKHNPWNFSKLLVAACDRIV